MSATIPGPDQIDAFVERNLRWNYVAISCDWVLFVFALSLISSTTVMPAFAQRLGASNLVLGAIPAVFSLGFYLPGIFAAGHIEQLPRKLPFLLRFTLLERVPPLVVALAALAFARTQPFLVLVVLLLGVGSMASASGALWPGWMELVAKVIPLRLRGRMFAIGSGLGALLGLLATVVVGYFLESFPFPLNYSLCFAAAFVAAMTSFGVVATTREYPLPSGKPAVGLGTYLRALPSVLRRDSAFAWFLVVRGALNAGALANGFFTPSALRDYHAAEWQIAAFTSFLLLGQTVGNLLLGYVGDRRGHKLVLGASVVAQILANLVSLGASSVGAFYLVFALVGASTGAASIAGNNLPLEYADPADRPTYVAMATAVLTPLVVLAPLLGGAIADQLGYRPVFALATILSLVSLVAYARLRDPRQNRARWPRCGPARSRSSRRRFARPGRARRGRTRRSGPADRSPGRWCATARRSGPGSSGFGRSRCWRSRRSGRRTSRAAGAVRPRSPRACCTSGERRQSGGRPGLGPGPPGSRRTASSLPA
jgi:MFS family permease